MKTQTGFTLIEVLIAMMVLAIGLLGFAALQAVSIKNNLAAYTHGQAVQLLYDMSDRIRANNATAASYLTTNSNNNTTDVATCNTTGTGCTAAQMAQHDLYDWNKTILATLPLGEGIIVNTTAGATASNVSCPATGNASIYNLCITWDDNRNGSLDSTDPILMMELQP